WSCSFAFAHTRKITPSTVAYGHDRARFLACRAMSVSRALATLTVVTLLGCSGSETNEPLPSSEDATTDVSEGDAFEASAHDSAVPAEDALDASDSATFDALVDATDAADSSDAADARDAADTSDAAADTGDAADTTL